MGKEELKIFDQMSVSPQGWTIEEKEYSSNHKQISDEEFKLMKEFHRIITERVKLRELLGKLTYHQSRMVDKWAEGDDNVKNDLWKNLHSCGAECAEYLFQLDKKIQP